MKRTFNDWLIQVMYGNAMDVSWYLDHFIAILDKEFDLFVSVNSTLDIVVTNVTQLKHRQITSFIRSKIDPFQ